MSCPIQIIGYFAIQLMNFLASCKSKFYQLESLPRVMNYLEFSGKRGKPIHVCNLKYSTYNINTKKNELALNERNSFITKV